MVQIVKVLISVLLFAIVVIEMPLNTIKDDFYS